VIVDGDAAGRGVLRQLIRDTEGFALVGEFWLPEEGLEAICDLAPDLVIVSDRMKLLDWQEFTRLVRTGRPSTKGAGADRPAGRRRLAGSRLIARRGGIQGRPWRATAAPVVSERSSALKAWTAASVRKRKLSITRVSASHPSRERRNPLRERASGSTATGIRTT
jgi:CheY-like chemotaxis protein